MAASMVGSAATGAGLEILFANVVKIILEVRRHSAMFRKTLEDLEDTLEQFAPSIRRIDAFNREFDRPEEIEGLKNLLRKSESVIKRCLKIHKFDYIRKSIYNKKLMKLVDSISKYINTILQIHQSADLKENLYEVKVLNTKISNLSLAAASARNYSCGSGGGGGGGGFSNGFMKFCSPPGLKVKPVGLEIPLKDLKEKLLKNEDDQQVIVVSAPGGCGKSTMAKALCQDSDINGKYKNIFFVVVSKSPNLTFIIERLFQHMECMISDFVSEEDALCQVENLFRSIGPDPFLLVLDDVWLTAESLVEKLSFPIPDYKILVTSRFELPQFGSSYKLQRLSDADSMTLFRELAFLPTGNSYRPDQDVVNKILKGCKGFPLAISVVARSLRGKSAAEWNKRVEECSKAASIIANFEVELLNCLQTSVDALNDNTAAKECYMDLGSFPEDHKIPATALIDMWVGHHNLNENNAIANLYELSNRNLVDLLLTRNVESEDYGCLYAQQHDMLRELAIIYAQQHDMLRELAIIQSNTGSIEQRKRLFVDITGNKYPEWWVEQKQIFIKAKLLSICTDKTFSSSWYSMEAPEVEVLVLNFQSKNYTLPLFMGGMKKLKVLIVANYGSFPATLSNFHVVSSLINLRRIRLEKVSLPSFFFDSMQLEELEKLSLIMCNISQPFSNSTIRLPNILEINIDYCDDFEELPDGFCDLISLRRLSITNCHKLHTLPEHIGELVNLEMLRLNSCTKLLELPETIGELHNLRTLDISDCLSIRKLPDQIGELCNLTKLYMIDCSIRELPMSVLQLSNLKEVTGDEETANSWRDLQPFLPNLKIKEHKDVNLDWLLNFC